MEEERRSGCERRKDWQPVCGYPNCPLHRSVEKQFDVLWAKSDSHFTKEEARELKEEVNEKMDRAMDKSTFWKFVASVVALLAIAASAFGYVALEVSEAKSQRTFLMANQSLLMKHFSLEPVVKIKEAEKVLEKDLNTKK